MISKGQYLGIHAKSPDLTPAVLANIDRLLTACNKLEAIMVQDGVTFPINPKTKSQISGETYGGFRPQSCTIGAPHSAHKTGEAVDRYDPDGAIDSWCLRNISKLKECGIYIEAPSYTVGWAHWSTRQPKSGKQVFTP